MTWDEATARTALARRRKEHLATMERLRGELGHLRASITAAAERAAAPSVGTETAKQAEIRKEAADFVHRVGDGLAAAVRAVPDGPDGRVYWFASFHQKARLSFLLDRHPHEFIADDVREADPTVRAERRESVKGFARRQIEESGRSSKPLDKVIDKMIRKAAATGTGVHFTSPTGERVNLSADRVRSLVAKRGPRRPL